MPHRRRTAAAAIALATLIALPLVVARRLDPIPNGLRAQYFPNTEWSGEAARSNPAGLPFTDRILEDVAGAAAQTFSASWNGWLVAPRRGAYTFATSSDDGSWVYVDGELVLDNGGEHPPRAKGGRTIVLDRGIHQIFVKYFQNGGGLELTFLWQRGGGPFEPVPSWAMRPRRITYGRFVADRAAEIAATIAMWGWAMALLGSALFAFRPEIAAARSKVLHVVARLREEGAWPALVWIVAASTTLNIVGLWWGLPHGVWVGDELTPTEVLSAWAQRFSGGWYDKYPPLHYYLLSLSYLPAIGIERLFEVSPRLIETALMAAGRVLSMVMGAVAVVATFFCGRRAFGPRAGLFGAAMFALVTPFIYYAKAANVDVPYLMWFAISLCFYLRVLEGGATADYVWWALTATLAVCTKDQAYGLYAFMPVAVIVESRRAKRPIVRPLAVAAVTAIVTFATCYNVVFNASGLIRHVETILVGSQGYRAYDATLAGRAALLDVSLRLVERNSGWPMVLVAVAGLVLALVDRSRRRIAVWLLTPIASYYLTFINIVLYNYDRFLLPVSLILAVFGGYAVDRLTSPLAPFRPLRRAAVVALFAYSLFYSVTVDALMLTDSRYDAERWLEHHVENDDLVATSSIVTYMPRATTFTTADIYDREGLERVKPKFFVVNADYTMTEPADSPLGQIIGMLRSGRSGYRLAFTARPRNPWPWLPGGHIDLVGSRRDLEMVSFLRNISPTIEIYERVSSD